MTDDMLPGDFADSSENPMVRVNYGVFEVTVKGGSGDSLQDVSEVAESRIAGAMANIEELKRTDFELDDEFSSDRTGGAGPMSY